VAAVGVSEALALLMLIVSVLLGVLLKSDEKVSAKCKISPLDSVAFELLLLVGVF
jgi:hypothetical protein